MHDWQYFFNHDRSNLNLGTYRIFEPEWKAEILHWFSQKDVDKQQKEDFIQALIDFDDGCGGFYRYRAYFLAAEALSQFPECSLGDVIVEQLLKWSYAYFRQDQSDWQILPQPLVKTARKILELTDRKRVIAAFVHLVHTTESRTVLRLAAEKLGKLDPGNKSAIAALLLLTPVVENKQTFCQISQNPGEIAVGDESAIASLVQTIETILSEEICFFAIVDLGKIAVGNPTAIASLIKFLQIKQGDTICFDAVQALWQIDPGNAVALKSLTYILETSASASLINRVVTYLLKMDPENKTGIAIGNKLAITMLSQILETTQHQASEDEYLLNIAETLTKILQSEHLLEVVIALKDYLSEPCYKNSSYRYEAAFNIIWHCAENLTYPDFSKAIN
ncbi:hypothetical protein [Nostoc sp.]|uniref:hypothetical protein n=1 Tax=Nostoc sp. TaxID=1180 RepID=UPI002FFC14E3